MKKEKLIERYLLHNKDNYTDDMYDFLVNNYKYYMGNPKNSFDILRQIYSKYEVVDKSEDIYFGLRNKISELYTLNNDIVEIASGPYPRLAEIIDEKQRKSKKGTINVYEPLLVTKRLGNIKLHKEEFNLNTKIKEGSLLIASAPCKVTLDIIRKANEENLEFFIALCGCCHEDFINYKDWINYVFDFANNGIKNESKIYKDSLDDIYNYPYPIIYKKCPKRY